MAQYNKVNVRLSNSQSNKLKSDSQLNKLKPAVKIQTGIIKINILMFEGNNLPHELLLTAKERELS